MLSRLLHIIKPNLDYFVPVFDIQFLLFYDYFVKFPVDLFNYSYGTNA